VPLWIDAQPGCQLESSLRRRVILPGYLGDLPPKPTAGYFQQGLLRALALAFPVRSRSRQARWGVPVRITSLFAVPVCSGHNGRTFF
jgi:hypothetical protein